VYPPPNETKGRGPDDYFTPLDPTTPPHGNLRSGRFFETPEEDEEDACGSLRDKIQELIQVG
jgi:hypothetical protein